MCSKSNDRPNIRQMEHAIKRNFGGCKLEGQKDIVEVFTEQVTPLLPTSMPEKPDMERKLKDNFRDEFKNEQVKRDQLYALFFASFHERIRDGLEATEKPADDKQVQQHCSVTFQKMWLEGKFDFDFQDFQEEYEKQYTLFFQEKFEEVKTSTFSDTLSWLVTFCIAKKILFSV